MDAKTQKYDRQLRYGMLQWTSITRYLHDATMSTADVNSIQTLTNASFVTVCYYATDCGEATGRWP